MSKLTLSIIMANYNHAHYVGEALEAIVSQSFRPLEVIIIDDASIDNSVEVLEQFVRRDPIVRLLRNERNLGPMHAVNRALKCVSGDYVHFAAADDRILPGLFEKSMHLLTQYPQAGLCCSDPVFFNGLTGVVRQNRLNLGDSPRFFSPDELAERMCSQYVHIAGHTSLIKRSALVEAGGFVPELKWHIDWFALLVIAFRHGICYIPEPLAALRVLPNSYSASGSKQWPAQREVLMYMLRLLQSPAYCDVLLLFKHAGVLSIFRSQILRVLLSNPEHWDYLSPRLIRRALWNEALGVPARIAPSWVKRIYRRARGRGRENMALDKYRMMLTGEARESGTCGHKCH